jgi:hypothetical protein
MVYSIQRYAVLLKLDQRDSRPQTRNAVYVMSLAER